MLLLERLPKDLCLLWSGTYYNHIEILAQVVSVSVMIAQYKSIYLTVYTISLRLYLYVLYTFIEIL